jgi:hypothetical protein
MLPYTSSAVLGPESSSPLEVVTMCQGMMHKCGLVTYAESVVGRDQRGARGCNTDCEGDGAETCCSGAAAANESCGVWAEDVVALLLGLSAGKDWLRKSAEGEEPEPALGRSVGGRDNRLSSNMVEVPRAPMNGEVRKLLGSGGNKGPPLGRPDQDVAYSGGGAEKGRVVDGGDDGWDSEGGLPSGEGLPKIAERMEYSRLAASEPKGNGDASKDELKSGSVGGKVSMTVNRLVR